MRNKALYYPYINLPQKDWTFKTLLYWDSILSIVPSEYIYHPDKLKPFMQDLVKEGLVEQVFPIEHLYDVDKYDENFLEFIEKKYIDKNEKLSSKFTKIHMEKLNSISDELIKMNLAKKQHDSSWLLVEKNVANDFMKYLADILAKKHNAIPVSDKIRHAKIYDTQQSAKSKKSHKIIRNAILHEVLPLPAKKLSIGEIVRFKEKYGDLLPEFKKFIDQKSNEILGIKKKHRNDEMKRIINDIQEESLSIKVAMESQFKDIVYSSILPVFADFTSVYGATSSIIAASTNNVGISGAALGVTGAVAGVSANIYSHKQENKKKIQHPVAYIAHIENRLS